MGENIVTSMVGVSELVYINLNTPKSFEAHASPP
jgi:hypothetical protein